MEITIERIARDIEKMVKEDCKSVYVSSVVVLSEYKEKARLLKLQKNTN